MGIYIKGMEIPKDGEHPYWVVIHSDGTVEYNKNKGQGWQTSEAVPVPPHGRLADLDKIEDEIAQLSPEGYTTGGIRLILDSVPTIIPAEEVEK